jgi:glycosyltransferase involved in cell wall biosynthesis
MGRKIRVLPLFADNVRAPGLLNKFRHFLLRRTLNRREIRWVANRSIAASRDLASIGVRPDKVLPFDWPPIVSPAGFKPRPAPDSGPFRLLYVGDLLESKGVGDAIRAIPLLPASTLTVVGGGHDELDLRALTTAGRISDRVEFRGKLSPDEVIDEMMSHHALLVPTRPQYPESLPMTIYEAFCTRMPVIASDHPTFVRRLDPDRNALIFPAGNSFAIARAVDRLRTSPRLYRMLSEIGGRAAETIILPLQWRMLLDLWLQDTPEAETRLASFSLTKRRYA